MTRSRMHSLLNTLTSSLTLAVALLAVGLLASPALAQEDEEAPEAKRYENVDWHEVVLVDLKPGKTGRAMEIIENNYEPAANQAGLPLPGIIEMQTGPWDMMLIWNMEDGPSEMTWETSPEGVEFQKAFVEVVGSEEEAEKIEEEYSSLVDRETSYIGFSGRHGRALAEQ